jgi:cyanate lyase
MGISLQDIAAYCGHSSVSVTEKFYAQAGGKDAKEKVEKLAEVIPIKKFKAS